MPTLDSKAALAELQELLEVVKEEKLSRRLEHVYRQIPANNCQRCADCCFNCAQVHPAEFLNIYEFLAEFPELTQARLAKRLIEYEMLNLTTLDYPCPFLEETNCVIYDRRPLQCRVFGLYPKDEYKNMVVESGSENERLAVYYARQERVLLPREVMQHDVEQCENNYDENGDLIILGKGERQHLHAQMYAFGEAVLPDEWLSADQVSFSTQFAQLFYSEDELQKLKVKIIKEYQSGRKRTALDRMLADCAPRFTER